MKTKGIPLFACPFSLSKPGFDGRSAAEMFHVALRLPSKDLPHTERRNTLTPRARPSLTASRAEHVSDMFLC